jgi:hypothetical protein
VDKIINISGDLETAIRNLRKNLGPCHTCPADRCPLITVFNHTLQIALIQIAEELNLATVV